MNTLNVHNFCTFLFAEKLNSGMLKFSSEDQNQDKWNEFVSNYILKCENSNNVAKNLNHLSNIREPSMTSQQKNKIIKILDIFHSEDNPEDIGEDEPIKNIDDIFDQNQIMSTDSIWTKVSDDMEDVFGLSDSKVDINTEKDSPKWLDDIDDEIVSLDWHFLMQKFKKVY